MMMKQPHIFLVLFALLVSCSTAGLQEQPEEFVGEELTSVSVAREQPLAASGIDTSDSGSDVISTRGFTEGSKLYFSQQSSTLSPNFSNTDENATPFLYIYEYQEDPDASWDDIYTFNFTCIEDRKAFNWRAAKQLGSVGNAFSFYAFYFPVDNERRFSVETDQRGDAEDLYDTSNFEKSDILGAYHATSSLYTRMRFRLFHLMVYLRVKIYVPVYQDTGEDSPENPRYSGFGEGALQSAEVINAYTDFSIDWSANRSSDTEAPLVQTNTGNKKTIVMYRHNGDEDAIIEDFNVREYYSGGSLTTDDVREYNFSVLFPPQEFGNNYFLRFVLKSSDNSLKYYYFAANRMFSGLLGLTQGTLQELDLYLPRTTNETILVGAKILPWGSSSTEMTVTEEKSDPENND